MDQRLSPENASGTASVFIGSSGEAGSIRDAVGEELTRAAKRHPILRDLEVVPWDLISPETTILATLEAAATHDFGVFVSATDDKVSSRGSTEMAPRDNVLFELGLFTGALGSGRTFVLYPEGVQLKVLSDLAGVILYQYKAADATKFTALKAAVRGACNDIADRMAEVHLERRARGVDQAHAAAHPAAADTRALGGDLLAVQVLPTFNEGGCLPCRRSRTSSVGPWVHVAYGIGQVISSGPAGPDQLAVVRFAGASLSLPVSELHLAN